MTKGRRGGGQKEEKDIKKKNTTTKPIKSYKCCTFIARSLIMQRGLMKKSFSILNTHAARKLPEMPSRARAARTLPLAEGCGLLGALYPGPLLPRKQHPAAYSTLGTPIRGSDQEKKKTPQHHFCPEARLSPGWPRGAEPSPAPSAPTHLRSLLYFQ